jgi:hypothetical protein
MGCPVNKTRGGVEALPCCVSRMSRQHWLKR